jgi:hypothetical protein
MVLLCYGVQVEACFVPFGVSANLDARWVHGLRRMYHRLKKLFWMHPMELLGDVGHGESCFGPLGDGVSVGAWFALNVP